MAKSIGGSAIQMPDLEPEEETNHNEPEPLESTQEQMLAQAKEQAQVTSQNLAQSIVRDATTSNSPATTATQTSTKSELLVLIGELNQEHKEAEAIFSQKKSNLELAHKEYREAREEIEEIETNILFLTKQMLDDVVMSKGKRAIYEQELPSDAV